MAVAKIDCPECGATLKPAKPLTPGKKVRCPKCDHVFVVPGAEEEEQEAPARKAPAKAAAGKGRKSAPAEEPAPPPKKKATDDDDDGGVYGVIQEPKAHVYNEADDASKPQIEYVPDLEVNDPRGPATAALAIPSNGILGFGALLCLLSVVSFCVAIWPFLFTKWNTAVTPYQAKKEYEKRNPKKGKQENQKSEKKEEEDSFPDQDAIMEEIDKKGNEKMREVWDELVDDDQQTRIIWACISVVAAAFFLVTAYAGVKMQNIESYRWSMAAAIMGMITILGLPFGVVALTRLKQPEIQEAFEYEPE